MPVKTIASFSVVDYSLPCRMLASMLTDRWFITESTRPSITIPVDYARFNSTGQLATPDNFADMDILML